MLEVMSNLTLSDLVGGINAILKGRVAICQRTRFLKKSRWLDLELGSCRKTLIAGRG